MKNSAKKMTRFSSIMKSMPKTSTDDRPCILNRFCAYFNYLAGKRYCSKGYITLDDFMDDEYKARFGENAFIEGVNMVDEYSLPYTSSNAACSAKVF